MRNKGFLLITACAITAAIVLFMSTGFFSTLEPQSAIANEPADSALVINEVMSRNNGSVADESGEFYDWIEIYNQSNQAVSLAGYALSDDEDEPAKWLFPDVTIQPDGYLIVFCSDLDITEASAPYLHANFKLSSGETAVFAHSAGYIADSAIIADVGADRSLGRKTGTQEWAVLNTPTPGFANTEEGRRHYLDSMDASYIGLLINELMSSNRTVLAEENSRYADWIELYNPTGETVDLYGFGLSDNPLRPLKWKFPEGSRIGAGEYLLIYASGEGELLVHQSLHTNFRLSSFEESVTLSNRRGQVIDQAEYSEVPADEAWARTENGWEISFEPTPGFANTQEGYEQFQAAKG